MLRALGVEQLLAVGELFKQFFLGGAYQLAVICETLGVWKLSLYACVLHAFGKLLYDIVSLSACFSPGFISP